MTVNLYFIRSTLSSICLLGLALCALPGQAQNWAAALARGGAAVYDAPRPAAAIDAIGNSYVVGSFGGEAAFGLTDTLSSVGDADIFVAKLSPSGAVQWAVRGGGLSHDAGAAIALDGAGHVYIGGALKGPASFGSHQVVGGNTARAAAFVAQLDAATGTWLWAWSSTNPAFYSSSWVKGIAADSVGNVYATGAVVEQAPFGPTLLGEGCFVVSFDATGAWRWTQQGGESATEVRAVTIDRTGHLFVAGRFNANTTWFGIHPVSSQGYDEVFVAQLGTATGDWQWASSAGCGGHDELQGLALDPAGSLYIVGGTEELPMHLGLLTLAPPPGAQFGYVDGFVAKLTANTGAWVWASRLPGLASVGYTGITSITAPTTAGAFVLADFGGDSLTVGPITIFPTSNRASFTMDVVVARIDGLGNWQAATGIGGSAKESAGQILATPLGQLLIVGETDSDTLLIGSLLLPSRFSIFVAQVNQMLAVLPEQPASLMTQGPWPNPARGTAFLTAPAGTTVGLIDCLGRLVCSQRASLGVTTLDLRSIMPGLYVVRCGTISRRLVVE